MSAPLVFFECGRDPDGGRFLHAFLPDGTPKHEWRGEHLVDVPALLDECGIPYEWEEWSGMQAGGFWMPDWVAPAIKEYMTKRPEMSLAEFVMEKGDRQ